MTTLGMCSNRQTKTVRPKPRWLIQNVVDSPHMARCRVAFLALLAFVVAVFTLVSTTLGTTIVVAVLGVVGLVIAAELGTRAAAEINSKATRDVAAINAQAAKDIEDARIRAAKEIERIKAEGQRAIERAKDHRNGENAVFNPSLIHWTP
jgi:hypothetical protein